MFRSITLKFSENKKIIINCQGIILFVGPNSSGKSLVLREIEMLVSKSDRQDGLRIVDDFELILFDEDYIKSFLRRYKYETSQPHDESKVNLYKIDENNRLTLETRYLHDYNPEFLRNHKNRAAHYITRFGVLRLDGKTRFTLTEERDAGDLLYFPQTFLSLLFINDSLRIEARKIIKECLGQFFTIDPTNLGKLRVKLSNDPPPENEQSLDQSARDYYSAAHSIDNMSDGFRAFLGIIIATVSDFSHTILLDEPEAFLHPPLARKLGKNLSRLINKRNGVLFVSTHSSDFLLGCLQSATNITIIRLDYKNNKSSARIIQSNDVSKIFNSPMMRSANAIAGLFHDGVIVTESENDRAFYAEILHRLTLNGDDTTSLQIMHAQNRHTVDRFIGPMRQFGIPTAGIVDIDVIKEGGKTFKNLISSANIPESIMLSLAGERARVFEIFQKYSSGKDTNAPYLIDKLHHEDRVFVDDFFDRLEDYGLFVVRIGVLECWLPEIQNHHRKSEWTHTTLERLGKQPGEDGFVEVTAGGVWAFLQRITSWIADPDRRGMP